MRLVPRLRPFTSTIFAEMSALATRTGAINLGQGFPDEDGPASVLQAAQDAIAGGINQYPPGPGLPVLRQAIATARSRDRGQVLDPDTEVLVTVGATEAIAAAVLALVDAGEEVISFDPSYDSYPAVIAMAGARHVPVLLVPDTTGRFALDPQRLRDAITPRTRMILLNSPHNPTGTVFSAAELAGIAALAVEFDLVVVADEVYEYLTFDGVQHLPIASFPGMAERSLTVSSAGKSFSVTGWKVGWACGPADLVAATRAAKQFLTYVGSGPFQPAVAHALEHEIGWVHALRDTLQDKRNRLADGLAAAGFGVTRPQGTYFITADISAVAGDLDGLEFCHRLPELAGVVAVPEQVFHVDPAAGARHIRFAFCKRYEVIDAAVQRLSQMKGLQ